MIEVRYAAERGKADFGWLNSSHSFSFGDYHDPSHMGFGPLRVINEDRVVPGAGFDTHGHRDMEILSYVLEGALEHKDSTGTGSVIRPGDIQRMTAGSGVLHSEYNHSKENPVHFLQIWLLPEETGLPPGYEQKSINLKQLPDQLVLIAGPEGGDSAVKIHQDVRLYASKPNSGNVIEFASDEHRKMWIQVARGELSVNGQALQQGDGAGISEEDLLTIQANTDAEFLLFDLPA